MSRAITVACIMALILAMSIWGIWYAHEVRQEFDGFIAEAQSLAESGDAGGLARQAEAMREAWERHETALSFYVQHDMIEQMTLYLINLKGYAATGSFPNALVTLEQMRFLTRHIYELELPNWNNVL